MSIRLTRRAALAGGALMVAELAFRAAWSEAQTGQEFPPATVTPVVPLPVPGRARAVAQSARPRVLLFYAQWCVISQRNRPFVQRFASTYENTINFEQIDIDSPEGHALVVKYQVPFVPTFVVLKSDGTFQNMFFTQQQVSQNAQSFAGVQ